VLMPEDRKVNGRHSGRIRVPEGPSEEVVATIGGWGGTGSLSASENHPHWQQVASATPG
jgi:hypothetical protein